MDDGLPTALSDHPLISAEHQRAAGKRLRRLIPRETHGEWQPEPGRANPLALLDEQNRVRIPQLVPVRIGRMAASPFAFYRGAAAVMAADLASSPVTGIEVASCGDAHLSNFGLFASPERQLLFDVNDFDETLPAPWEWDVKRLAASGVVAARQNGFDRAQSENAARGAVRSYRERMITFARLGALDIYYSRVDADSLVQVMAAVPRKQIDKALAAARRNTAARAMAKLTVTTGGLPRIVDQPPLVVHPPEIATDQPLINAAIDAYASSLREDVSTLLSRFRPVDMAHKVVGVGSVGTRCFIALFLDDKDVPLFLQVKEAQQSVLERYWRPSSIDHHGHRVVSGQRVMQSATDIFLGSSSAQGHHFYVRQLRDMKGSAPIEALQPAALTEYLELCGWALARAHAQSGRAGEIAGYLGSSDVFDQAIVRFAAAYADQSELDHQLLLTAINAGQVVAQSDA
ncbi:MAG: hypothetical protein JWO62_2366 [Acidimicrobiaceae bacterium]|nr:hypothetical protein [Acidimicrobiaceae bacterium]